MAEQFEPIDFTVNNDSDKQSRMGEINWDLKVLEPVLYLARQDRKTITRLSEAKDIKLKKAMEEIYELEFSVPYYVEKYGEKIKNPNIDKIGVRLLVRLELGDEKHWFVMMQPSARSADTDELTYKCYSTANQMSDVTVRGFDSEETPRILSDYLNILVDSSNETYWSVGVVDGDLDSKFRMFSFDNGNLLQAVYELATKFEAVVEFDTENAKINMYSKERYKDDSRLIVSHDNYLLEATKSEDGLAMATQLVLYGSDNLTVNRVNPTGTNYIEDFSYFLDGFEIDVENGDTIISSSKYMSDELALAIVKYSRLVEQHRLTFSGYIEELDELEKSIIPLNIELNDLKTKLKQVKDAIDIWLTKNGGSANEELIASKIDLELEIASKQAEIGNVKTRIIEIAGVSYITDRFIEYGAEGGLMGELKALLSLEENFTAELLDERSGFIIRKEYSNESIIDDKDLLEEGQKEFARMKEPKLEATMNIVNFLELIEGQRDWDKLVIGDSFRLLVPEIDLDVTANISTVDYDFETGQINVTITNVSRNKSQKDNFLELIYKANSSANSIQVNKGDWNKGKEANDKVRAILENVWDATKNKIEGGVYSSIEISDRGILSRDPDDPDNTYLVLLNGLLAITKDGGNSWKNAITPMGVIAERLYGQIITGQNLTIGDADGILQFVGNKGVVSDADGNMVMKIGLVEEATVVGEADKFGILLFRGDKNKVYLTQEDGLVIQKSTVNGWEDVFSADIEGEFTAKDFSMVNMRIVNANIEGQGVYLDSIDGIRIDGQNLRQILINADKGIEMLNSGGDRVFYVDNDGNINVRGINILSGNLAGRDVETIGQAIDDVSDAITDLDAYVDGAFKDSVISTTEAKAIATHLETLDNEKADIDAQFTSLYSNTSLTGTPKVNLYNAKQDYDSAHVLLKQAINTAITDSKVSSTEKANVDAKFTAYRTALNTMSKTLQEANDNITTAKIEPVKTIAESAQSVAIGADSKAQTAISGVNDISSDMKITPVEKRELQKLWNQIISEFTQLTAFGDSISVSSTNYTVAYQELDGVAPKIAVDILANMTSTYSFSSTTARDNFRNKIINYYNQREIYKSAISTKQKDMIAEAKFIADNAFSNGEIIGQVADEAKASAETALTNAETALTRAQTAIDNAQTAMTNAQGALDGLNNKENAIIKSATAPTNPTNGQVWLDISNASLYQLKRWNGTAWITATPTTASQVGAETLIYKQTTAPTHLSGRLWMDTSVTPNILKRSTGTAWVNTSATTPAEVGAEPVMFKQNTAPSHLNGRLWLDTTNTPNKLYRSDGSTWLKVTPTTAGEVGTYTFSEIDTALNNKVSTTTYTVDMNGVTTRLTNNETAITQSNQEIALRAKTSDVNALAGRVDTAESQLVVQAGQISQKVSSTTFTTEMATKESTVPKSSTAPTAPATDSLWIDTGFTPNIMKRWTGSAWVKVTPSTASEVGAENVVYKQSTAPSHLSGRLWLNTATAPNIMYRSDGTSWIKTSATTPAEVGAEAVVSKQTTAPSSPATGQLWVDTSVVPNILKRWSGSAWIKVTPTTPAEIGAFGATEGTQLTTRVTTAEGSITNLSNEISQRVTITDFTTELNKKEGTMFKQSTAPSSPALNTIWLDTSVTPNAFKRWDGSAWVKANPTSPSDIGAYALSAGEGLNTRLSTAEGTITNLGNEITQRVTITNFNTELSKKQATIPKQATAPTAVEGAMWIDSSVTPNILKTYTSGVWVNASPTSASEIGAEGVVLKQNTAPAHLNGRLWLDTSVTPNILKRSTGSAWVNATPTTASEVGAEGTIFKQATAPAHLNGRLWTDTSVTPNVLKRSDGTNWIKMTPTTASEVGAYSDTAGTNLAGRVSTAEGTITNLGASIVTKVSQTDLDFTLNTKYGNLVNNISVNGNTNPLRWSPHTATANTLTVEDGDFNGATIPLLKSSATGDVQVYSDTFEVEPTRAYEVVIWIKSSLATGLNYFGLHAYDNVAPLANVKNVTPVTLSTGVAGTPTNNGYFWSGAKTTSWRKMVAYIFPYGTDPATMKGLSASGNPVTTGFIMSANTNKLRIRLLNYGNAGASVDTFYAHPKVTDFQPEATVPRLTSAESSITSLSNSISLKVNKTEISTTNNTGIFKDVLNQRLPNATYTGYMMITTGLDMTNQMTKLDIKGFNYSGVQGLIDLGVSFYAYSTPSFVNASYSSRGSYKMEQVMLARNASGKVVIILGKRDSVWEYPQINVPEMTVSFGTPLASFGTGWTASVVTTLTGLTNLTTIKEGGNGDGVNLIGNSTFNDDFQLWENVGSYATIADAEQDKPTSSIMNISVSGKTADNFAYIASKEVDLGANAFLNDVYFLSFDMKVMDLSLLADTDTVIMIRMYNGAEDALGTTSSTYPIKKADIVEAGALNGTWKRYVYRLPKSLVGRYLRVAPYLTRNGNIYYREIQVERNGTSGWTQSPTDTNTLMVRVKEAEQKITDDSIISTVRSSTAYTKDLSAYLTPDALAQYGYADTTTLNTAITALDTSLKQLVADGFEAIKTEYSSITQTDSAISLAVSTGGGANKILNSVGWAGTTGWTIEALGDGVTTVQDEPQDPDEAVVLGELESLGSGSGWVLQNSTISQSFKTDVGQDYTVSCLVKKTATKAGLTVEYSLDPDTATTTTGWVIGATANTADDLFWQQLSFTFTATSTKSAIKLKSMGTATDTTITNLIVNVGKTPLQWSNHPTELYTASARFDRTGLRVSNNTTQNYTVITPKEFAGYAPVAGTMKKIFTLNGATTEVKALDVEDTITIGTIKMLRINSGGRAGIAFLPTPDDDTSV